ncbi:D-amino-acid transaminase [Falsirhodobacter algicola]|uniref:Probable branched-chain-amino-acid aminotransferase n=1 Tax=Falsirhodobacter algicola TaxID=2692330 RepID=A0A8J8SKW9_9RHOB|nr:D-amino-acid transaminase [Falsirhodobacter algicola]QUS35907.1 D-amino-acid transaminase [Falsirhodobacter algicola]
MTRTVYVNGEYLPETEAKVSIFDRGFLMGDAVYEVTSVLDGKLLDYAGHEARLARSLAELDMRNPLSAAELLEVHRELVTRNEIGNGLVYLQISRGSAGDRNFLYPDESVPGTAVLFTQSVPDLAMPPAAERGIKVIAFDDLRWGRRDIKTVQLLWPSMAKMAAKKAGCDDAFFVKDGVVTEGSASNAYIVKGNRIITRPLSNDILHGITRASLLVYAAEAQFEIEERAFTIEEAQAADEAFITGASTFVMPVIEVDGKPVGAGKPGKVARRLREIYVEAARKAAI